MGRDLKLLLDVCGKVVERELGLNRGVLSSWWLMAFAWFSLHMGVIKFRGKAFIGEAFLLNLHHFAGIDKWVVSVANWVFLSGVLRIILVVIIISLLLLVPRFRSTAFGFLHTILNLRLGHLPVSLLTLGVCVVPLIVALRAPQNGNLILKLHDLHLVVLIGLFDILSWLRKMLSNWSFLSVLIDILRLNIWISQHLLQENIYFLFSICVLFLKLVLKQLLLNQSSLFRPLVRAVVPRVRVLLLLSYLTRLVLLLGLCSLPGVMSLSLIPSLLSPLHLLLFLHPCICLWLEKVSLGGFAAVDSLWLVSLVFLVWSRRKVELLLLWANFVRSDHRSNHAANIIFVHHPLQKSCYSGQLGIIRVIVPIDSWDGIFRVEEIGDRRVIDNDDVFHISTEACQVFDECVVVICAVLSK